MSIAPAISMQGQLQVDHRAINVLDDVFDQVPNSLRRQVWCMAGQGVAPGLFDQIFSIAVLASQASRYDFGLKRPIDFIGQYLRLDPYSLGCVRNRVMERSLDGVIDVVWNRFLAHDRQVAA